MWEQKTSEYSFTDDLPFTNDLLLYTPSQNLNDIWKYLMIAAHNYRNKTPYPDKYLLWIAYNNVTYMGNLLHPY